MEVRRHEMKGGVFVACRTGCSVRRRVSKRQRRGGGVPMSLDWLQHKTEVMLRGGT